MSYHMTQSSIFQDGSGFFAAYAVIREHVETHSHDFIELAYMQKGRTVHTLNDGRAVLQAGDFVLLADNACHSYQKLGNDEVRVINCLFLPKFIDPSLAGSQTLHELLEYSQILFSYQPSEGTGGLVFHDETGNIGRIFQTMVEEYQARQDGYLQLIRACLLQLIIYMVRQMQKGCQGNFYACGDHDVALILRELELHYCEPISVASLAEKYHLSESHLCRKFRKYTQCTIRQYVQRRRIAQAKSLLLGTSLSIAQIGTAVGYQDAQFFSEIFRRETGSSPRSYRQVHNSSKEG